ncbi:hypothetical protein XBFFL1_2550063 [Xenorhabdus bovienii str. feltiae Florida]|nr:hypothetical protein XBFFR1_2130002 [Xenorhabdus bovienii str. feltiae France]CDG93543.1 hypothetical protein XBFFL1_2550063 [Xenorhabdus bovienii str. feltiae Florida]
MLNSSLAMHYYIYENIFHSMKMELEFEWNPAKAESNFRKHGIRFEDGSSDFCC